MKPDYWKIAQRSLWVLLGILILAIVTKISMFFVVLELFGTVVAVFLTILVSVDLFNTIRQPKIPQLPPKPETPVKPKRVRKPKTFNPPSSL
jgi:hypothetical protein